MEVVRRIGRFEKNHGSVPCRLNFGLVAGAERSEAPDSTRTGASLTLSPGHPIPCHCTEVKYPMLLANLLMLAEQAAAEQQPAPWYSTIIMFLPIAVLGYLLLMRPAQRQERERRALLSKVKKNDKVINSGGIIGYVDTVKDDEIVLKGGLHITRASVVSIVPPADSSKE